VNSSQNIYSYGSCLTSPPCRWGDYSGAAVDPSNPNDVWVTGEYSASNAGGVSNNWGTYTARLTLSTPTTSDFTVSASPSSISIGRNQTGSYAVTATSTGGYAGTITWSVTGVPVGTTFTFSPSSVTLTANETVTSTLTVSSSRSTPTGPYTLTITGTGTSTSGATSHSTTVTLTITGKRN